MGHGQLAEFIMTECMRGHGRAQLFLRRDGLENTPERVAARQEYLAAHPETRPAYRQAILEAGITPGMSWREAEVAWGFDEQEKARAYCRQTGSGQANYFSYHGFKIGEVIYTFYIIDVTVSGISYGYEGTPDIRPFVDEADGDV